MRFELMACADDLTGALDSGVQFAKWGAAVTVLPGNDLEGEFASAPEGEVLVVNTASRHLHSREAYRKVYETIRNVQALGGARYYYKKTDSALRGNIGAELDAMMDALDTKHLVFAPAYPALGRTTRGGRQYVQGVPLEESIFARDPLQPADTSDVKEIIARQCGRAVYADGFMLPDSLPEGIHVMDGETDGELMALAKELKTKDLLGVTAGCAGFAEPLGAQMNFQGWQAGEESPLCTATLCLCGSMNAVSLAQCEYAAAHGYERKMLRNLAMQKGFADSLQGRELIRECADALSVGRDVLLQSADREASGNVPPSAARQVEENMALLGREILKNNPSALLCVVGGDTLLEAMKQMGCTAIRPLRPAAEGLPVSLARTQEGWMRLASKSGGFGPPEVLVSVARGGRGNGT